MSFKEQVLTLLPKGSTLLRMYSVSQTQSKVEYQLDGQWHGVVVDKVDLSKLSELIPFISVDSGSSFNDLYQQISIQFDLGLVKGTDYENPDTLFPDATDRFVELPVLKDSLGYHGVFRCRVRRSGDSLNSLIPIRDLTSLNVQQLFPYALIRMFLVTNVITLENGKMFSDVGLSSELINVIATNITNKFTCYQKEFIEELLQRGQITGLINDGISDLFVFKIPDGNEFFVRFSSSYGDLPNSNFIFNSGINTLDDNSEGLLSGSESVDLENPVENEGSLFIGKQDELTVVNDIPIPLVTPKENILVSEEQKPIKDILIKETGNELVIIQEEVLVNFE